MRPSNTRPQHHPPDGPPSVRTRDRTVPAPSNIQPTLGAPQSAWIPACAGMTEGSAGSEGIAGATEGVRSDLTEEGPRPKRSKARCRPHTQRNSSPHSACEIASPTNPAPAQLCAARAVPLAPGQIIPISRRGICVLLSHPCAPPSFLRRQESMRPSNTRPQHHAPDGPPNRPHARSDRPSAVEHPTYARRPSVRLDSCLRRNDGGERRSDGGGRRNDGATAGGAGMTEGGAESDGGGAAPLTKQCPLQPSDPACIILHRIKPARPAADPTDPAQQLAPLRLRDRLAHEPRTGQIAHQQRRHIAPALAARPGLDRASS